MKRSGFQAAMLFVFSVCIYQLVTYIVVGMAAAALFNYQGLFQQEIIRDYYRPFGSVEIFVGPILQLIRGALLGLVLLPLRGFLKENRLGWLWLWLVFIGIGILGTPAAAPASLEGLIYTKIPLWFHLIGLPEMCVQTLVFSILVHRKLRAVAHPLPAQFQNLLQALMVACLSFIGYTVISLVFALASGIAIGQQGTDYRVLGQFTLPLLLTLGMVAWTGKRWWPIKHLALYGASVLVLAAYQGLVLGGVGWLYVLVAPLLPGLICLLLTRPKPDSPASA